MPLFFLLSAFFLALPVAWPAVDLLVSGLFYRAGQGFYLADHVVLVALHWLAYDGARVLGVGFAVMAGWCWRGSLLSSYLSSFRRRPESARDDAGAKGWLFLLLALLVGPVLVANVGLKDHWGRARPREIVEFGGTASFSPALEPHFERAHSNGSFVSGDGAFGFFLPSFAYVAPRRYSRRVFWGGMAAGCVFGLVRIIMGAHFFSDVVYAAATMLVTSACVYAAMYGRREMVARWRGWF